MTPLLEAVWVPYEWIDQAACRGTLQQPKRELCLSCPVRWECLHAAFVNRECGMWGGLTDPERERFLRKGREDPERAFVIARESELAAFVKGRQRAHGSRGCYRNGCRCVDCLEAERRAHRKVNA